MSGDLRADTQREREIEGRGCHTETQADTLKLCNYQVLSERPNDETITHSLCELLGGTRSHVWSLRG